MEVLCKYISAVLAALCALLCPITPLITTAMFFIFVDFVTGVAASYAVAHREGRAWWIESRKAWRTILKAGFTAVAIIMMWFIDSLLLGFMNLHLANLFTGFVCGMGHGAVVVDSERMTHLRSMASMLTRRLSDYLNAKQDECLEYNPCCNPINYCSIDGGIVQIY